MLFDGAYGCVVEDRRWRGVRSKNSVLVHWFGQYQITYQTAELRVRAEFFVSFKNRRSVIDSDVMMMMMHAVLRHFFPIVAALNCRFRHL